MSDVVERLRWSAEYEAITAEGKAVYVDAADEIERLRAELALLGQRRKERLDREASPRFDDE